MGQGSHFDVDEKDFFSALYAILNIMVSATNLKEWNDDDRNDFKALLKCMGIVFCQKKQLSGEITNAFIKRLSLLLMSTIVISVVNFCLASQPFNCWWADGGYTTETFANSSGVFEARYLAYDPVQRWAAEVACEGAWVR